MQSINELRRQYKRDIEQQVKYSGLDHDAKIRLTKQYIDDLHRQGVQPVHIARVVSLSKASIERYISSGHIKLRRRTTDADRQFILNRLRAGDTMAEIARQLNILEYTVRTVREQYIKSGEYEERRRYRAHQLRRMFLEEMAVSVAHGGRDHDNKVAITKRYIDMAYEQGFHIATIRSIVGGLSARSIEHYLDTDELMMRRRATPADKKIVFDMLNRGKPVALIANRLELSTNLIYGIIKNR